MTRFISSRKIFAISSILLNISVLTLLQNGANAKDTMYFGFFFNAGTASDIKNVTDLYLRATNSSYEQFSMFLRNISSDAGIKDTLQYYQKPKDPNTQEDDPLYHVTAKFCENNKQKQKECAEYAEKHNASINKTFDMELVGFVLTNRTFGVRIRLTEDQEKLFEKEGKKGATISESSSALIEPEGFPNIKVEPVEEWVDRPVTNTSAHITLGCAPGIPAVTTGPDMEKAIGFEVDEENLGESFNDIEDPLFQLVENQPADKTMNITRFNVTEGDYQHEVYVIYPKFRIVAKATFRQYYYETSGALNMMMTSGWKLVSLSLALLFYFHKYL